MITAIPALQRTWTKQKLPILKCWKYISMPSPRPKIPGAMKLAPILRPEMAVLMVIQALHKQMAVVS
jgi:hypothetical protein